MNEFRISRSALSLKLLVTSLLCMIGLFYILLLCHIYVDTEMKVPMIIKAYGEMEFSEITDITHRYMPHYTMFLFAIPLLTFMFTSYSEKVKRIFAVLPFLFIILDIGSMYLIPYLWAGFAYLLWAAGTCLAFTFLILFVLNMGDLWLRKS